MLYTHTTTSTATSNGHAGDRVEVSQHARLLQRLLELPPVRTDVIDRARQAIAEGAYDAPRIIDATIERLVKDLLEA